MIYFCWYLTMLWQEYRMATFFNDEMLNLRWGCLFAFRGWACTRWWSICRSIRWNPNLQKLSALNRCHRWCCGDVTWLFSHCRCLLCPPKSWNPPKPSFMKYQGLHKGSLWLILWHLGRERKLCWIVEVTSCSVFNMPFSICSSDLFSGIFFMSWFALDLQTVMVFQDATFIVVHFQK